MTASGPSSSAMLALADQSERAQLLTADELAERWQVRKDHVYRLVRDYGLPCVRLGKYVRFRLAAIEAWEIDQGTVADA